MQNDPKIVQKRLKTAQKRSENGSKTVRKQFFRLRELILQGANISETAVSVILQKSSSKKNISMSFSTSKTVCLHIENMIFDVEDGVFDVENVFFHLDNNVFDV